ncbi:MAG TPA: hypothetical protein VJ810_33705 [Blastocatellia bacterium]|nr:hypothetical protein [Blastocatellia bacterium]
MIETPTTLRRLQPHQTSIESGGLGVIARGGVDSLFAFNGLQFIEGWFDGYEIGCCGHSDHPFAHLPAASIFQFGVAAKGSRAERAPAGFSL